MTIAPYVRVPVWAKKQLNTLLAENAFPHELVTNAGVKLLAMIPSFAVLIIPPTLFFLGEQLLAFIKPARLNSSLPFSFMWLFMPVLCDSFRLYQSLLSNFSVNSWWRNAWHRVLLLLTAADTKHTATFWNQHGTALQSLDILNLINLAWYVLKLLQTFVTSSQLLQLAQAARRSWEKEELLYPFH